MSTTLEIVRFCAIECEMQQSGELSVYHMVNAWDYAQKRRNFQIKDEEGFSSGSKIPTEKDIKHIGALIEPKWNKPGYRTVDVRVGWDLKMDWSLVPEAMHELITSMDIYKPEQWFYQYEQIHPWRDGNGRSGVLLYNWMNDTLEHPIWAPNYWNDPRRKKDYGA